MNDQLISEPTTDFKLKDIQVGDALEYERILDVYRGSYKLIQGVVIQKYGQNIEVDQQGSRDWWYWPQIRHCHPRLTKKQESQ